MAAPVKQAISKVAGDGPADRLKGELRNLMGAVGDRALETAREKVGGAAERLTDYAEGGGGPGLMAAVTGAKDLAEGKSPARAMLGAGASGIKGTVGKMFGGKGKGGQGGKLKVTNIEETIDIGAPVSIVYNQWTQFRDFPSFTKKVETVEQESDEKLHWKAQVFWSHREWDSTILRQIPDKRIIWRSKGPKGSVDGAVTFHEIAPDLTRVLLALEYHPQGFFERTGNLWRAQGRRVRLELKHFRRHVMSQMLLHPDEVEGWRGEIEDGEVVRDHETALREEQQGGGEEEEAAEPGEPEDAEEGGRDELEPGEEEEYAEADEEEDEESERGPRSRARRGEPEEPEEPDEDEEEDAEPVGAGRGRGRGRRPAPVRARRARA